MTQIQATISRLRFDLDAEGIDRALANVLPDPIADHFVVVGGRRYPPKQVIGIITGLDRADFTTHQARRVLSRLGFTVGRRSTETQASEPSRGSGPHGGREAELLRPFAGRWVAQRGLEVLVAADTPQDVLAWLERHNRQADAMFLVPSGTWQTEGETPR
ncbi:MAG TPA: SCO5918 family protein [Actinomycetota bacterium]|nr:SCO5918 family protein [Actinomycetota bacterium]